MFYPPDVDGVTWVSKCYDEGRGAARVEHGHTFPGGAWLVTQSETWPPAKRVSGQLVVSDVKVRPALPYATVTHVNEVLTQRWYQLLAQAGAE